MAWEESAFAVAGLGNVASTAQQLSWIAAGYGANGVLFSELYADPVEAVLTCQSGSTPFTTRDLAWESNGNGLWVIDDAAQAVYRCADPSVDETAWTEQSWSTAATAVKGRCIAPTSGQQVMISAGDGIWRRSGAGAWSQRLAPATAFASTARLYRRCLVRVLTSGVMIAYDPDVGVFKSVNSGVSWFLAWTHTGGGDNAWLACSPTGTVVYLGDGTTTWRLNEASDTSGTKTWDAGTLTAPTDCTKVSTCGAVSVQGHVFVLVTNGAEQDAFRSITDGASWENENDGNLYDFTPSFTTVAITPDGWMYASSPTFGMIRGTFEGGRLDITCTADSSSTTVGGSVTLTVTLSTAAPTGGQKIWTTTSDWEVMLPEPSFIMAEGETTEDIEVEALATTSAVTIGVTTRPQSMSNGDENNALGTSFSALGLTGGTPIQELGTSTYQGRQGGLYGGGSNTVPDTNSYRVRGQIASALVTARNTAGAVDAAGKIGFASIGFSNPMREWDNWVGLYNPGNSAVTQIQGAQSGMDLINWFDPFPVAPAASPAAPATGNTAWDTFINRVRAKCSDAQLQVVWGCMAVQGPQTQFPSQDVDDLEAFMLPKWKDIRDYLSDTFPNLVLFLLSNRTYSGYHALTNTGTGNPEPYAYQNSFIVRSMVEDSINDDTVLWTGWGPEWWGNGENPRTDNRRIWLEGDYWDGTHESLRGNYQTTLYLEEFFTTNEFTEGWFN